MSQHYPRQPLELLAPAKTTAIGQDAILHGADAVYIGGPAFGARDKAGNSISDIAELVTYAHRFHARIYVTLNTILHDAELEAARKLAHPDAAGEIARIALRAAGAASQHAVG